MPDQVTLFKEFVAGLTDYMSRHNTNYSVIEAALNQLFVAWTGQAAGPQAVSTGLAQIFDRAGIIGVHSYHFNEGVLSGPNYNLVVPAGYYWDGSQWYSSSVSVNCSLATLTTGDYYVNIDSGGVPSVSAAAGTRCVKSFHWDTGTHAVSARTQYCAVLFDGDDYADQLTSAARAKSFTKVADRLEEIEVLLGKTVQTPASANTINVNWALGGIVRVLLDRATTTFNFSGAYDGQKLVLELTQDEVGGREVAFGAESIAGTDFTFPVPLSADPDKIDYLGFIYNEDLSKYHYVSLARGY